MKKLNTFTKLYRAIIQEARQVIPDTLPILKENIQPTLDKLQADIFDPLGITRDCWRLVGSAAAGKNTSDNIDIAVNIAEIQQLTGMDLDAYSDGLDRVLAGLAGEGWQIDNRVLSKRFNNVAYIKVPIENQPGEFVQCDLKTCWDFDYAEVQNYSPRIGESKYPGWVRGILFDNVVKVCSIKAVNPEDAPYDFVDDNGWEHSYPSEHYTYMSRGPQGYRNVEKTFRGKRGGLVKNARELSRTQLGGSTQQVLDTLFGEGRYTVADFSTFQRIWAVITAPDFEFKSQLKRIIKRFINAFKYRNQQESRQSRTLLPSEIWAWGQANGVDIAGMMDQEINVSQTF